MKKDERLHKDRYSDYKESENTDKDITVGIVLFSIVIIFSLIGESLFNLIFKI